MRVTLLWVEGDAAADFRDLIGTSGEIRRKGKRLTFMPDRRGDWLSVVAVAEQSDAAGRWRVTSSLSFIYVFRLLKG